MNFLVRYFQRSVEASGNSDLVKEMNEKISKWESRLERTIEEGIAIASQEAVVEESVEDTVNVLAKDLMKELADEIAMNKQKASHGNKKAAQAQKELMQFRSKLQGKSSEEIVKMFQQKLQLV